MCRTVVFRIDPHSETADSVAIRLRVGGVKIIEQETNMLLVAGEPQEISKVLGNIEGWKLTAETMTPPPETHEKILKSPIV